MELNGKIKGYITIAKADGDGGLFVRIDGDSKDYEGKRNLIEIDDDNLKDEEKGEGGQRETLFFVPIDKEIKLKSEDKLTNNLQYFINRHCEIVFHFNLPIDMEDSKIESFFFFLKENKNTPSIDSIEILD